MSARRVLSPCLPGQRRLALRALGALAVLGAVGGLSACASSGGVASSNPFELRGATTVATPGWIKSTTSDGDTIYLAPQPILGAGDVQRATVQKDATGRAVLLVQFSPAATLKLTAGTRALIGRQLAAVVQGRVTNLARVTEPMSINTMALTGFASFDEATQVAHQLSR